MTIRGPACLGQPGRSHTGPPETQVHVLVAGVSREAVCGVRDHASILSAAMAEQGADVSVVWHDDLEGSGPALGGLARELERNCRDKGRVVVLLHYSVFAFSWRGIPVGVPFFALRLRHLGLPVVLFAHEFAYPWGRRGWRGTLQALTQRVALVPLVAASRAIVVTTPERVQWLQTRRWLPRRPINCTPIFSNIGPVPGSDHVDEVPGRVGVFSFGAESLEAETVVSAIADLRAAVPGAHLVLIGAPGPNSPAGRRWAHAAEAAGCPLMFTGVIDEAEVSRQLSSCRVVAFPDPAGPAPRRGSLAAALAHGKAVVALDGPQRWEDLVTAGAVVLAQPTRNALGAALRQLLDDEPLRASVSSKARAFAQERLSPVRAAKVVLDLARSAVEESWAQ